MSRLTKIKDPTLRAAGGAAPTLQPAEGEALASQPGREDAPAWELALRGSGVVTGGRRSPGIPGVKTGGGRGSGASTGGRRLLPRPAGGEHRRCGQWERAPVLQPARGGSGVTSELVASPCAWREKALQHCVQQEEAFLCRAWREQAPRRLHLARGGSAVLRTAGLGSPASRLVEAGSPALCPASGCHRHAARHPREGHQPFL